MPVVALPRRRIQSVWLLFFVALVCRLAAGIHFLRIGGIAYQWKNEIAAIARSLVLHHAFAGAYAGYAGPTAWAAPGYPFVVAAVFKVFGIDSQASAFVLLLLNGVFSSLTAIVIYKLGREYLTETVGWVAAWLWALSPLAVMMTLLLWDTSLSALMLSLCLLVSLRATSIRQWTAAGALWGLSALVSPALLAPLPAVVIFRLWKSEMRLKYALAFCLTMACVLLPWSIRNRVVMHANFPVRSNGWAEIYFGNVTFDMHPCARSNGLYQQSGETRFVQQIRGEVIQYVERHPIEFLRRSAQRWLQFWLMPMAYLPVTILMAVCCWAGAILLVRNGRWAAIPFVAVMLFYPLIYSVTHIETRYRHPMEPVQYLLVAYCLCELARRATEWLRSRQTRPQAAETYSAR